MIPELPPQMSEDQVVDFYDKLITQLEARAYIHTRWFTHKGSGGSMCWICDLVEVARKLERELEAYISKSALDYHDVNVSSSTKKIKKLKSKIQKLNDGGR